MDVYDCYRCSRDNQGHIPLGWLNNWYGEFGSAAGCYRATTRNVGN
jgi:hypothetical protein